MRNFRVLRPIHWRGRTYCPGERLVMNEDQALELVESGHLVEIADAPKPLNGADWAARIVTR